MTTIRSPTFFFSEESLYISDGNAKKIAVAALVFQNTALVLLLKLSRQPDAEAGPMYVATAAVVMQEVIKLTICWLLIFIENDFSFSKTSRYLKDEILRKPYDTLKLSVPAVLYVLQSNLLYGAIDSLDAATFQVLYQLKILTTAAFSVSMLKKSISPVQWLSLLLLMIGIALVSVDSKAKEDEQEEARSGTFQGLCCVLLACISSGFAGVYFEKILKGSGSDIWLRNIQLSLFGLVLGSMAMYHQDGDVIASGGFFQGYTPLVCVTIPLNAFGGLLIALVVKYADNILKGFATSVAIILSSTLAMFIFEFSPSANFMLGSLMVITAVGLYNSPSALPKCFGVRKYSRTRGQYRSLQL